MIEAEPSTTGLDARVIGLWRLTGLLFWVIVSGVTLFVSAVFLIGFSGVWVRTLISFLAVAIVICGACLLWFWPPVSFRRWAYRLDERVVRLRHGVLWQTSVSIPVSRLQHVDLHRGPLERRFGLASLEMHTAGTQNASHRIPGLSIERAEVLRDRLVRSVHHLDAKLADG